MPHRAPGARQCLCLSHFLKRELSCSLLGHGNLASASPHAGSAQLLMLEGLINVIHHYSALLSFNTGFLSFLNTVLSVNCPKVRSYSRYKLSTFPSSPSAACRWHDTDTQLCSFFCVQTVAASGSSPPAIN